MILLVDRVERERISEVLNLSYISSYYEEELRQLIDTISKVLEIDCVYVSLIEDFKQIIKIKKGVSLDANYNNDSMSYYVLQSKKPIVIHDFQADRFFRESTLLHNIPNIKFYACAPLISRNKHIVGMLNICDFERREFNSMDIERLQIFSALITNLLETNQIVYQLKWQAKNTSLLEEQLILSKEVRIKKILELEAINKKISGNPSIKLNTGTESQKDNHKQILKTAYFPENLLPDKKELPGYNKNLLKEENLEISAINIPDFMFDLKKNIDSCLTKNGNLLSWNPAPYSWYTDENLLKYICRSIICHINKNCKNNVITIHSFHDQEYSIMVLRYNGTPITKKDLVEISALHPQETVETELQELFYTWHMIKILGGFITAPDNHNQDNYVSFGLPKRKYPGYKVA